MNDNDDDTPDWKIDHHVMYGRTTNDKPKEVRPLNRNTTEYRVKEMLFSNPNMGTEQIMEKMGLTSNSSQLKITELRSAYLHTVDFLIRNGATGVRGRNRRRGMRG